MRIKVVWKKRKDLRLCTNILKRIKDTQKPSLETAMQYCKTKFNISQCSQNYLEAPLQDSFIIAGLSSTPTKLEHWSHIDDKISFFQHAHLLEARLTTLLNKSRASNEAWVSGQLLSRKVRGWSIFRCISSSMLKTCEIHTLLIFICLAPTKYANEVTCLATPRKALNENGHTFSTCFMILRPLGMSFLRLAISTFFKGQVCYIGRLGTSRKTPFICKINEIF